MSLLGKITGADKAAKRAKAAQGQSLATLKEYAGKQETVQRNLLLKQRGLVEQGYGLAGRSQLAAQKERAGILAQGEGMYDPYMEAGAAGARGAQELMGQPIDVTQDPGYQFRMQQGQQAQQRRQAAAGTQYGGGALKELARYSQGLASQEYGAAFGRRQQQIQNQMGMAQLGMGASQLRGGQLTQQAANVHDPSALQLGRMQSMMGVEQAGAAGQMGVLEKLSGGQSQYWQNMGDIGAQQATSGFQSLMGLGTMAAGMASGAGALGWKPFGK